MSEAQETIADIVAEKRREAQCLIESAEASAMCGETMADTPYTEENLEFARQNAKEMLAEADRLEAAAKRKRVEVSVRAATSRYREDCRGRCPMTGCIAWLHSMFRTHRLVRNKMGLWEMEMISYG